MKFLWILLGIAAALAPIFWLMPSPRQRAQMALRKQALVEGLKVKLERLELEGESQPCVAYRWLRPEANSKAVQTWQLVRESVLEHAERRCVFGAGWRWEREDRDALSPQAEAALIELLNELPEDVFMLESGSATLTAFWHERGTLDDVTRLKTLLVRLDELTVREPPAAPLIDFDAD